MDIKPPNNPGFSVASAGKRLFTGKRGVYRKIEYRAILANVDGLTNSVVIDDDTNNIGDGVTLKSVLTSAGFTAINFALLIQFETENPSSRIRHAFGVGAIKQNRGSGVATPRFVESGCQAWVNVIPGMKIPGIEAGQSGAVQDLTQVINGQPIYPYFAGTTVPGTGPASNDGARQAWNPLDVLVGGFDGTANNSGGTVSSNGQALPFAYDAISSVTNWRIRGGVAAPANTNKLIAPLYAWASWEIIDPRDEEDSQALLADCHLHAHTRLKA